MAFLYYIGMDRMLVYMTNSVIAQYEIAAFVTPRFGRERKKEEEGAFYFILCQRLLFDLTAKILSLFEFFINKI